MSKLKVDQISKATGASPAIFTLPAADGTANQLMKTDGSGQLGWATDTGGLFSSYAIIADRKAQNTAGGTFTNGAWRTRDLQTKIADPDNIVSISTNAFTLTTGSYLIRWGAQADAYTYQTQSAVHDGSSFLIYSHSTYTAGSGFPSTGVGRVTVSGSQAFTIQHVCTTTRATTGFGIAGNFAAEIYTLVEIFKEA